MKRFKNIVFAALAVIVAASYGVPSLPASAAASSASLSIVPKKNYTIEAGKSVRDTLVIRNLDQKVPLSLNLRVIDFTYSDDGGTPKLMLDEDAPQTTWSLKPFLTVPKSVTIPPRESRTLNMSVAIPAGHGAGSYYSAIVYSSGASEGGNVGLSASGVTLVFTQIPGKVKEDLKLEGFGAYKGSRDGKPNYTFFSTDEPQVMAYTLKNNGNVTEAPAGSITIRGLFGNERTVGDVNPNNSLALIGQTRTFTSCIQLEAQEVEFSGTTTKSHKCVSPGLWPGFYTASLDLYYGQNGNTTHEVKGTASFLYLPLWFIIVSLIVILAASYYIWKIYNAIRAKFGIRPRSSSRRRR